MNEQRATFIVSGDLHREGREPREGHGEREKRKERELREGRIAIGSDRECHIRLDEHFTISGRHADIEWDGENFYLTDADPAHITFVNHREAEYDEPVALAGGDIVQIGPYVLEIEHEGRARLRITVTRLLVNSSFLIKRDEAGETTDAGRWEGEVLLICNPPDQTASGSTHGKLILNKPKVSPLHAGISRFRDPLDETVSRFYLIDLSASNNTYLNGHVLRTDEMAALSSKDVAQIGPFDLTFNVEGETLHVVVRLSVDDSAMTGVAAAAEPSGKVETGATAPSQVAADALRIFWAKRTRGKAARLSPFQLQRTTPGRVGKARYKWRPTTDLARTWPLTLLLWCVVVPVAAFALVMAWLGLSTFSPRALSAAHAGANFNPARPIARQANANACTTCHTRGRSMETNCATCHQTDTFTATVTAPHQAAGIGCISCHSEHRGAEFRPGLAPFNASFQKGGRLDETCAGCHNDQNSKLYQGRRVFTPHGGTFGYPVVNEQWKWEGLDEETWRQKPEELKQVVANWPVASGDEGGRRSAQFHALHLYRVRTTGGLTGAEGGVVSCSTCHKSYGASLDRETPRTTCVACHSGRTDAQTGRALLASDQPDCTSCHVQHVRDTRRKHPLLASRFAVEKGRP
ncbi:MAG TPA: FHA domain-containing protein [Pyrinomonadaceae bacterium]